MPRTARPIATSRAISWLSCLALTAASCLLSTAHAQSTASRGDSTAGYTYVDRDGRTTEVILEALRFFNEHPTGVDASTPAFAYGSAIVLPTDEVIVTFARGTKNAALLLPDEVAVVRRFPALRPTFLCRHLEGAAASFDVARRISALPTVVAAQPNFLVKSELFTPPDDPFFNAQWHLDNTGQGGGTIGADIGVLSAWDVTEGYPAPIIAILDEGVDVAHPDLHILPGHDATDQPAPGNVPGNASTSDPHGTVCAGLAAARTDNALGVAGASPESAILPVRIGYGNHWSESAWVIDGITWATDQGAGIISGSWGGSPPATAEEDAIDYARTVGRNGLGCLVCFAVGNSNGPIAYPARYASVFAVGASSPCDERANPASCDGQNWWGSNFGPQIDLVAPGPDTWTTDYSGAPGFSNGDYYAFTGTSASCPLVAGSAALALSIFPTWTVTELELALTTSAADQVGLLTEDAAGWDQYMGWGRLDVGNLIQSAVAAAPAGPTQLTCQATPAGLTLDWTLAGPVTAIDVRRNGLVVATLPGTATTFLDATPLNGSSFYSVQGFSGTTPTAPTACAFDGLFVRGDTNRDTSVDIVDAVFVLTYLFNGGTLTCVDAADIDDSGSVQINDPVMLLSYLFQSGPAPALPFPMLGTDPTLDSLPNCQ